jgi:tetratricopeptide (TPR) repeat protein
MVVFVVFFVRLGSADEQTDLEKGRNAYLARQYDEADARFRAMLDPAAGTAVRDRSVLAQARMLWGAVLFAKGKREHAEALFERLLLDDPSFDPDPLSFPTDVINVFIDTRAKIRELLRAAAQETVKREAERRAREEANKLRETARIAKLERLAREESVVEMHSRLIALVPFGAGQFQNGQRALGLIFLSTELACVAVGSVAVPIYFDQLQRASESYSNRDTELAKQYLNRASTIRNVNLSAYGAFALAAIAGVVHAQMTFVPQRTETRPRAVPSQAQIVPFASPALENSSLSGAVLGVSGRF